LYITTLSCLFKELLTILKQLQFMILKAIKGGRFVHPKIGN